MLGADTEVLLDGRALGKPADRGAGAVMPCATCRARAHLVRTAVCLVTARGERAAGRTTPASSSATLSEDLVRWYADTGEWRDRAGGYAIQGAGAALVERVEGDPTTVVGLPGRRRSAALLEDVGPGALVPAPTH